jgi:transformation/transcription domain-associated protein
VNYRLFEEHCTLRLVRNEGKLVRNLPSQVGRKFPQAVYFPTRTLYLTLKIEQRGRYKTAELAANNAHASGGSASAQAGTPAAGSGTQNATNALAGAASNGNGPAGPSAGAEGAGPIRATAPMWRCSRIMHMQRDLHPTVCHLSKASLTRWSGLGRTGMKIFF